jgi:hypothetical protein
MVGLGELVRYFEEHSEEQGNFMRYNSRKVSLHRGIKVYNVIRVVGAVKVSRRLDRCNVVLLWVFDPLKSFSCTWSIDTAQHQIGGIYELEGRTLKQWAKGQNYQQCFLRGAASTSECLRRVLRSDGISWSSTGVLAR